jgi:Ca-activated chloride channel homolog
VKHLAIIAGLVAIVTLPGGAQQAPDRQIFRSGADLVAVNVTVTDGHKLVRGLQQQDFVIYEDGVPQQIQFFESSDLPLDLILLIDNSSSMRDRMPVVHAAASGFMNSLRDYDRGAVVTFGDSVQIAQPLTSDKAALERAIHATKGHGGTALHNALYIALKEFGRKATEGTEVRRQAFALLSDGEDTASILSLEDVLEQVRRSGVMIYTINLRTEAVPVARLQRAFEASAFGLRRLARESGGQAFTTEHVRELHDIYATIAEELASQYSIGYVPSSDKSDGAFRRLVVQVTGGANLRARTRTGYIATGRRTSASAAPVAAPAGLR